MDISPEKLQEFYQVGWEKRWVSRLNKNFVPGDAGYKYRLFNTLKLIKFNSDEAFTLLDLGCGIGIYDIQILRKFKKARIWGTDMSTEHIETAKKLAREAGVGKRACFKVANVANLISEVNPDVILATEILEHLPDPIPAIQKIKQLANLNTQIIISVPNKIHETETEWVFHRQITGDNLQNIQTEKAEELDETKPKYSFYHKEYELQEIKNLLAEEGLHLNKMEFCFFQHPEDSLTGFKKWYIQKLNYLNRRIPCNYLDHLLANLSDNNYYETIILDCSTSSRPIHFRKVNK